MTEHHLKCWPEPFQAMWDGRKTFEFRKDDRGYQVGDVLHLREYEPDDALYTDRQMWWRVTYVLREGFGVPEGYCVMGISAISPGGKMSP